MRTAKNTGVKGYTLNVNVCFRENWTLVLKGLNVKDFI